MTDLQLLKKLDTLKRQALVLQNKLDDLAEAMNDAGYYGSAEQVVYVEVQMNELPDNLY